MFQCFPVFLYKVQRNVYMFQCYRNRVTVKVTARVTDRIQLQTELWCFHTRARQRQGNDKTNVEPVHFYYAFHTRSDKPGVKGIIGMHKFNFCLVVVLSLSCSGVKAPLHLQCNREVIPGTLDSPVWPWK